MSPEQEQPEFELFLFHRCAPVSLEYLEAGVSGIVIDFERHGKELRQSSYDTEINHHTFADLRELRRSSDGRLLCRLSSSDAPDCELSKVIESGADEIIVPMLKTEQQAERIVRHVNGSAKLWFMVETVEALQNLRRLCALPFDRVYVGLNDLRISRGTNTIFAPIADGTLDEIREQVHSAAFGFGGLTLPGYGNPLPGRHLYAEMARLNCGFTFLRRSFYRDAGGQEPSVSLRKMSSEFARMQHRNEAQTLEHHRDAVEAIRQLEKSAYAK